MPPVVHTAGLIICGILVLIALVWLSQYVALLVQARMAGVRMKLTDLLMMRIRKTDPKVVVINCIRMKKAGLEVSTDWLEAHALVGGRVSRVVDAMIAAKQANVDLSWERATAIDLSGDDVVDAVRQSAGHEDVPFPPPNASGIVNDARASRPGPGGTENTSDPMV